MQNTLIYCIRVRCFIIVVIFGFWGENYSPEGVFARSAAKHSGICSADWLHLQLLRSLHCWVVKSNLSLLLVLSFDLT